MSKITETGEKIVDGLTEGYERIEEGVVNGYKKVENTFVGGYKKIEDAFVNTFIARKGESVEEAKTRMADQQQAHQEQMKADAEKRATDQKERIEASRNAGRKN